MARWRYGRRIRGVGVRTLVSDTFTRADSTSTLGSADTGQAWSAQVGTWGISGNQACETLATGSANAVVDAGVADGEAEVDVTWQSGQGGLVARSVDGNDLLLAIIYAGTLELYKIVAGLSTALGSYAWTPVMGTTYNLRISARGSAIKVYLDGTERIAVTETAHQSATKWGIWASSSSANRFDNFKVRS